MIELTEYTSNAAPQHTCTLNLPKIKHTTTKNEHNKIQHSTQPFFRFLHLNIYLRQFENYQQTIRNKKNS